MLSDGRILSEREVLAALGGTRPAAGAAPTESAAEPDEIVPEVDRTAIEQALQQVGGNRSAAARRLGISRRALYRRLDAFGLR
jgi:DNA-binding NtrC family response regulator